MGRLGLIDGAKLVTFSTLPEVKELATEQADRYASMAEGVAARYAEYDTGKSGYREDMPDALCLIGEQLVVRLGQVPRRIEALGLVSETQGPHSYNKLVGKIDEIVPILAREILDFFALTPPKHGVLLTKVFASPLVTDARTNLSRLSRGDEEQFDPFVEFDEVPTGHANVSFSA